MKDDWRIVDVCGYITQYVGNGIMRERMMEKVSSLRTAIDAIELEIGCKS